MQGIFGRISMALLAVVTLVVISHPASAQKEEPGFPEAGTITSGGNVFDVNDFISTSGMSTDLEVAAGTDHQFATDWWYRLSGQTAETNLPAPDLEMYVGDTATLTWNSIEGVFSAELVFQLSATEGPSGQLSQEFTVTNIDPTGAPVDVDLFNYVDMDLAASAGGDSAVLVGGTTIMLTDAGTTAELSGVGADAFQVEAFPALRDLLNDAAATNLSNGGLPFGPGDFTGAFQWTVSIPMGGSQTFQAPTAVNRMIIPVALEAFSVE